MVIRGISEDDMFNRMLTEYHQSILEKQAASAPPVVEKAEKKDDNELSLTAEEAVAAENRRFIKCCLKDCRRRSPTDCIHKMCFLCCYEVRRSAEQKCTCPPHYKETVRREEEDRYIESLLLDKSKPRPLPRFFEEKFTAAGQTVTIWCLRDFFRNKAFCDETLQQEQRQFRQRASLQRREELRGNKADLNPVNPLSPTPTNRRASKRGAEQTQFEDDDYFKATPPQDMKRLRLT